MKRAVATALLFVASAAAAQGAPSVNESTGDLTYSYPFQLPKARGRFQPELALVYSSAQNRDTGFGHGWSLTGMYVERDTRAAPAKQTLWLARGTDRKLLVPLGAVYRPEVEDSFFEVTPVPTGAGTTFSAKDAIGTAYVFDRLFGSRAWLTRVTELDGNVTEYGYDPDKADPTAIRYNLVGAGFFANEVKLEFRGDLAPRQPDGVDGGAFLNHGMHLWRVRINGPATASTRTTIRGYEVSYSARAASGATGLATVTQFGLDFAAALPPTTFTYQQVGGYGLGAASPAQAEPIPPGCVERGGTLVSLPGVDVAATLLDVDGDGRPDAACVVTPTSSPRYISWLRNVTPPGAAPRTFDSTPRTAVMPANGYLRDFDGDGLVDILVAWMSGSRHIHSVYRGTISNGAFAFTPTPIELDVTDLFPPSSFGPFAFGSPQRQFMADLNGDGVTDYASMTSYQCGKSYDTSWADCTWVYGLTELVPGGISRVVKQAGTLPLLAGGEWYYGIPPAWTRQSDSMFAADLNGDGIPDAVRNLGTLYADTLSRYYSYRTTTGDWQAAMGTGAGVLASAATFASDPSFAGFGDGPDVTLTSSIHIDPTKPFPVCINHDFTSDDPRSTIADLLDFNGDGRPDFFTGSAIGWNTGRNFAALESYWTPNGTPWASAHGRDDVSIGWTTSQSCLANGSDFDCCGALLPRTGESYAYQDVNGDGIPDLLTTHETTPRTYQVTPGVLFPTDPSLGTFPVARPLLLRMIQAPDGAVYTVDYVSSLTFDGLQSRPRPMVSALGVSGTLLAPNKTYYWYSTPSGAPAWYDVVKRDDRGYAESWTQDEVTRIVRHTRWKTGSHALVGRPEVVESGYSASGALGTPAVNGSAGGPPTNLVWFARQTVAYGVRNLGAGSAAGCVAFTPPAEEPSAAAYPLRVIPTSTSESTFHGGLEAKVTTTVACGDVDPDGNTVKASSTSSLGGIAGKTVVTTQTFIGWLPACRNAFDTVRVARWDGAVKVSDETKRYDASCRLVEQYAAGSSTPMTNRTTFTYAGPYGLLDSSTSGGVTKRISYDAHALNVSEELSDDGQTALSTTYTYDSATGLRLSFSGPRVVKKGGTAFAGPAGITRYYLYDAFGRTLAVGKTDPTPNPIGAPLVPAVAQVKDAVEAYQYLDAATPPAVVSYRFSVPQTYSSTGPIPGTDDAARSVAYRDGLGRVIQVRERLGGGGAADIRSRVTQTLGGYKVAKAVFPDGAGREQVSLEPFHDVGEAFVDYRSASIPATRGTVTTFDAQGRPWCTAHQCVVATLPGPATTCSSDSSHSSSFRLATETRYGTRLVTARGPYGGNFVAVDVYPPDQNVAGGAMRPAVKLLGPAGEELGLLDGEENRTWVERDALGREIASWREAGPRYAAVSTPSPASTIVYNLAGQVWENWDANSTKVKRRSRYDEAGRLVYVTTDPATGEGIEYYFGPGDLGRVTEVREVSYPVAGGAAIVKLVARNHYDSPYYAPDPGYSFVAGKLSWTENAETTIAYSFDDAGRVSRRDQWFLKLDPTKAMRFTVSSTYGTDGRVLESRVVNPYSTTAAFQYLVDYDSAGHPVTLAAKLASQASFIKVYEVVPSQGPSNQYGGYDALGRVPVMRADDGRAVSARRYNGYSGALEGECKRFGDALACGTVSASVFGSPPALDAARDIYRTDRVAATYRGAKLASYEDSAAATRYTNLYLPNGRLQSSQAQPTGAVGSLTQDWLESFLFSGIGNLGQVTAQRNATAGNARPDQYETERYTPELSAGGQALDRVAAVASRLSATYGGAPITGTAAATPATVVYGYDLLGHLTKVTRSVGESETLVYAPGGELLYRQVGEKFTFYVGEYATVTARGLTGCGASCTPQAATVEVDNHVIFAGTRIASVKPSRTLYYYRTRLGTVVATSYRDSAGYSAFGAGYRYTPYGEVELSVNETDVTRSELGHTNALRLTGSLLYLKNRVYDAEARVFIQADTVDRLRYAYVEGDPVNASDPTGLEAAVDNPIVGRDFSRDGSFVRVVETHEDGSKTYQAYNMEVATDREGLRQAQNAIGLQNAREPGLVDGAWGKIAAWVGDKVRPIAELGTKLSSPRVDPAQRTDQFVTEGSARLAEAGADVTRQTIDAVGDATLVAGGVSAGARLAANRATGKAAERVVAGQLAAEGADVVGAQVTANTSLGRRVWDFLVKKADGTFRAIEVKAGGGRRTAGQVAKDAEAASTGATLVGERAGRLKGTTQVIETEIRRVP